MQSYSIEPKTHLNSLSFASDGHSADRHLQELYKRS